MKKPLGALLAASIASSIVQVAVAKDDFYGIIESRPAGKVGTWVVDGRSVEVTDRTELNEQNGPLEIGACVEVDIENGEVEEIETEPRADCTR